MEGLKATDQSVRESVSFGFVRNPPLDVPVNYFVVERVCGGGNQNNDGVGRLVG